jgi:hypothetical protein
VEEMVSLFADERLFNKSEPVMSFTAFKQMMASAKLL